MSIIDPEFWLQRWVDNDIFFHGREANPLLIAHVDALSLAGGGRLFLPLCGKTLDIHWLLARGYSIAGAELSTLAIDQLFVELGVAPQVTAIGDLLRYSADGIDIYVGDIFALSQDLLGAVDATYDRAALVALPEPMRGRYAAHLTAITDRAPQLLITFDYDQSLQHGPPFSVGAAEVDRHYSGAYALTMLAQVAVSGGLRGKCPADETVWLLT